MSNQKESYEKIKVDSAQVIGNKALQDRLLKAINAIEDLSVEMVDRMKLASNVGVLINDIEGEYFHARKDNSSAHDYIVKATSLLMTKVGDDVNKFAVESLPFAQKMLDSTMKMSIDIDGTRDELQKLSAAARQFSKLGSENVLDTYRAITNEKTIDAKAEKLVEAGQGKTFIHQLGKLEGKQEKTQISQSMNG